MFNAQKFNEFTVISGYDDGSDWIVEGRSYEGIFGSGRTQYWQYRGAEIRILDLSAKSIAGTIALDLRLPEKARVAASPEANRLYVIAPSPRSEADEAEKKPVQFDLTVVDLTHRAVVATLFDQPVTAKRTAVVTPDGSLLLESIERRDGEMADVLTCIDGGDFSISECSVPIAKVPDTYAGIHWHSHSPDGRWWLRFDHTSFPMIERSPAPGEPPRRYYGVTMQLWSAFPLKFERRIVVCWLKAENLPDQTHIFRSDSFKPVPPPPPPAPAPSQQQSGFGLRKMFGRKGLTTPVAAPIPSPVSIDPRHAAMMASVPERDRVYAAISQALDRPDVPPTAPFPERADFGEDAASDPVLWLAITTNLDEFVRRAPAEVIGWEEGQEVVWFNRVGYVICAGMDGSVSPQIWSERLGEKKSMMVPFAEIAEKNIPLAGRKLLAIMPPREAIGSMSPAREGGSMEIDGSPAEVRYEPVMIPMATDGWRPGGSAIPLYILNAEAYRKKVAKIKLERSIVRVPAKSLDSSGRADAITQLAHMIEPAFFDLADDSKIEVVFEANGQSIREAEFFSAIGPEDQEWAVPVLRHVIERYVVANTGPRNTYYQPEGESVLAHAVLRLAELDHASLPLVRAFGQKIDGGHEYFFASQTVPAVIAAHGWTKEVTSFLVWVLIYNFYNTYDRISTVWRDLGLYGAVSSSPPETIAAAVRDEFAPMVENGQLSWSSFAALRRELRDGAEQWELSFLDELERLVPGSTSSDG